MDGLPLSQRKVIPTMSNEFVLIEGKLYNKSHVVKIALHYKRDDLAIMYLTDQTTVEIPLSRLGSFFEPEYKSTYLHDDKSFRIEVDDGYDGIVTTLPAKDSEETAWIDISFAAKSSPHTCYPSREIGLTVNRVEV